MSKSLVKSSKLLISTFLAALLIIAIFVGCSRKDGEPQVFTGKELDRNAAISSVGYGVNLGKLAYAQVNRDWILWCYADYRKWIGSGQYGVMRWDDRSQCTFFASSFEVYVQMAYFRQAFHNGIKSPGAAVGTIWYLTNPELGFNSPGHAVNMILTQNGIEYFEPQSGKFVILSAEQINSAYFKKFD